MIQNNLFFMASFTWRDDKEFAIGRSLQKAFSSSTSLLFLSAVSFSIYVSKKLCSSSNSNTISLILRLEFMFMLR